MYTVSLLAFLFVFFCLTINHNATSTDTWGRKVNFSQAREVLIVCPSPYSRVVHGFTSSGMLESQYQGFAEAAKLGSVGDKYIDYGELMK